MEPRSLFKFYEENRKQIERIFARTFDETGDWDWVFSLPNTIKDYYDLRRKCRYSFDRIRFKPKKRSDYDMKSNLKSYGEYFELETNGTLNAVSNLIAQENRNLTNFPIEYLNNLKTYALLEIDCKEEHIIDDILHNSLDILFFNNGLTIHRKIHIAEYRNLGFKKNPSEFMAERYNNSMYDIYSSGWSNCVDMEYLKFIDGIKLKYGTEQA